MLQGKKKSNHKRRDNRHVQLQYGTRRSIAINNMGQEVEREYSKANTNGRDSDDFTVYKW